MEGVRSDLAILQILPRLPYPKKREEIKTMIKGLLERIRKEVKRRNQSGGGLCSRVGGGKSSFIWFFLGSMRGWEQGGSVDLRKLRWEVTFVPTARVVHLRGASSSAGDLASYTVQLVKAKQKFVQDHSGARQARWYGKLIKAALLERLLLYNIVAGIARTPRWKQRASIAYARYQAVRG